MTARAASLSLALVLAGALLSQAAPTSAETALKPSSRRGFYVFQGICASCHGMTQLHYGDFLQLGVPEKFIENWATTRSLPDGLTDTGALRVRHAGPDDAVQSPYPTPNAAKKENGGDVPPDLSSIALTIRGGTPYIQAMLRDFKTPPPDMALPPGRYYDPIALTHHHAWHMRDPWTTEAIAGVRYPKNAPKTPAQMSADVTAFLAWSATPYEAARRQWGILTVFYAAIVSVVLILLRRSAWRALPAKKEQTST